MEFRIRIRDVFYLFFGFFFSLLFLGNHKLYVSTKNLEKTQYLPKLVD